MPPDAAVPVELFETPAGSGDGPEWLEPGACVLRAFAAPDGPALLDAIDRVSEAAPFRHMVTRGGGRMAVAMTNCGTVGWLADRRGYRYDTLDPLTGLPWPTMSEIVKTLAARAADAAGFDPFAPDACLVNRYQPGTRLSLHQDRDEQDFVAPIVSVSLGVPATFLWGGETRAEKPRRVRLEHGDVVVWGGPARLRFHGVDTLREGGHASTGRVRFNLTVRRARLRR